MEKSWKSHGKLLVMEKSWNSVGHGKSHGKPKFGQIYFVELRALKEFLNFAIFLITFQLFDVCSLRKVQASTISFISILNASIHEMSQCVVSMSVT